MEVVIDANRVIAAALVPEGKTADLIFSEELHLFAPEFLREEIGEHKEELLAKSGLSVAKWDLALTLVFSRISLIPFTEFSDCVAEVKEAAGIPKKIRGR